MKLLQGSMGCIAIAASLLFSNLSLAAEPTDQELGKQYLYCGVLYMTIEGETTKTGTTMLALSTMLLGKNSMEAITPELKAAKQLEANAIEEAITQAILDSGASKTFVNSRRGMQRTGLSDKVVVTADGTEHPASHTVLLPTQALSKGARVAIVVPCMQQKCIVKCRNIS